MAEPLGTSLAVLAAADQCVKYGKTLLEKYRSFKNAEQEISELVLCLHDHWIKFEFQISFLKTIWSTLDERLQVHQNTLLHTLQVKLQEANNLLDSIIGHPETSASINEIIKKRGHVRKGQYALSLKDCLEKSVKDLDRWHSMFDPSWFLITLVSNHKIDQQLTESVAEQNYSGSILKGLRYAVKAGQEEASSSIWISASSIPIQRTTLSSPNLQLCKGQGHGSDFLINTFIPDARSKSTATTREVRKLARVLSQASPSIFGLLTCYGVIRNLDSGELASYEFVLSIPKGLRNPQPLRSVLQDSVGLYTLNDRLHLARQLANSTMYVHSSDFIHKNIRPETIVVFSNDESLLGASFLVGFEKVRPVDSQTFMLGDLSWEKDIYRHPARQGLHPEDEYIMQHDIYSLGVCLLEIGLWTSFVIHDSITSALAPGRDLRIKDILTERSTRKRAEGIKKVLLDIATRLLPTRMGHKYTNVVLACLKCLDKTNNYFGDEESFQDQDGILVGVRYIETVILKLQEISV